VTHQKIMNNHATDTAGTGSKDHYSLQSFMALGATQLKGTRQLLNANVPQHFAVFFAIRELLKCR